MCCFNMFFYLSNLITVQVNQLSALFAPAMEAAVFFVVPSNEFKTSSSIFTREKLVDDSVVNKFF